MEFKVHSIANAQEISDILVPLYDSGEIIIPLKIYESSRTENFKS